MTLELSKIVTQVSAMGNNAARRARARDVRLPEARGLLAHHRHDLDLVEKVEAAKDAGWFGALPASWPLDAAFDPPALPDRITIVAADGSQIYPDRHSVALYYVINIGSIVLRLGTGETPLTDTEPSVCFDDDQLYLNDEYLVSGPVLNARRALAEMTRLAQLAIEEVKRAPTVALADGNIALRAQGEAFPGAERDRLEHAHITQLNGLREAGVPAAGFIARPGTTAVARLLELAKQLPDHVTAYAKNAPSRPFDGLITDARIFDAILAPGQRSAVFEMWQSWSRVYRHAGHAVHFFYLRIGAPPRTTIARVEVPEWVAADADRIGLTHAALVDQCAVTDIAYPYALIRADELAVITNAEKTNFEQMIGVEMMRQGIDVGPSEKAATKTVARYGKKR